MLPALPGCYRWLSAAILLKLKNVTAATIVTVPLGDFEIIPSQGGWRDEVSSA